VQNPAGYGCCFASAGIWRAPAVSVARTQQFSLASQPVCTGGCSSKTTTAATQRINQLVWVSVSKQLLYCSFSPRLMGGDSGKFAPVCISRSEKFTTGAFYLMVFEALIIGERATECVARKFSFDTLSLSASAECNSQMDPAR
jgi:hypothetical protein